VLVLLHGLGATGEVWDGVAARWAGSWVIPDLPGHGGSDPLPGYSFGSMAAELAGALGAEAGSGRPVVVLGHSLGGVLGLVLGSGRFGLPVAAVCGLGIKLQWSPEELARAGELAGRPSREFGTRAEAVQRALKVAGLWQLVPEDTPVAGAAVVESAGGWRLALDNAAFGVGAPDMAGLLAACRAQVVLAAGEHDPMCPPDQLRALRPDAVVLHGLGHNAHVEDPAALQPLLDRLLAAT
jgi:pimeloyl-ACP methyl ester carboxylesterase